VVGNDLIEAQDGRPLLDIAERILSICFKHSFFECRMPACVLKHSFFECRMPKHASCACRLLSPVGFGGLVAGAELSGAGLDVTVQDAHISAGECAGTFYTIFTTI